MLAVIDNGRNFEKVTTLKITKLSSRYLPMLAREVFWEALPCLTDVTLHVAADWRTVEKDNAGLAAIRSQHPSEAVRVFHKEILRDRISMKKSIKKLNIGWYGGGEHAEGMFARNTNILPAPITQLEHCTANSSIFGLVFKSVEHLTLSNCWISPPTLEGLVKSHSSKALKKLTLDSVSLTAHPRFPPANGQGGGAIQLAQAAMAMGGQLGNNAQLTTPYSQPRSAADELHATYCSTWPWLFAKRKPSANRCVTSTLEPTGAADAAALRSKSKRQYGGTGRQSCPSPTRCSANDCRTTTRAWSPTTSAIRSSMGARPP